jgi:hypothetical protein
VELVSHALKTVSRLRVRGFLFFRPLTAKRVSMSQLMEQVQAAVSPQVASHIPKQLEANGGHSAAVLQFDLGLSNVPGATPRKRRRGKSMSRRRGQNGYIEQSGKWWVVRYRIDVPGQEERVYVRERICPISGPGSLTASERKRRAKQIIDASGADTEEHFKNVIVANLGTTFREQAKWWPEHTRTRKRKPVASATLDTWEDCLRNWLNPELGDMPLQSVNNLTVKTLVSTMVASGRLGPESINNYVQVVKMIVASAVNENGEQIHPRKWNHEFIDLPVVDKSRQNAPSISSDIMTGLAAWKHTREQMLFILCAAAGLRISEALGLEIDKHISEDFLTIFIRQKAVGARLRIGLKRRTHIAPSICIRPLRCFSGNTSASGKLDSYSAPKMENPCPKRISFAVTCTRL